MKNESEEPTREILQQEIDRLKKINAALIKQIEGGSQSNAYALFKTNAELESVIVERTEEIKRINLKLAESSKQAERLLLNVLPAAIADELRAKWSK